MRDEVGVGKGKREEEVGGGGEGVKKVWKR